MCLHAMTINRTITFFVGTAAAIAGLIVSVLVVKGLGDVLFPEVPGLSVRNAALFLLAAMLVATFLFVEAYRLFKAAAESNRPD